jgi:hypothetical protein
MDTSLVVVTLASLSMAAILSVVVWRLLRDERQRSDARVAALARMATDPPSPPRGSGAARPIPPAPVTRPVDPLDLPLNVEPPRASRIATRASDPPLSAPRSPDLFVERPAPTAWSLRLLVMVALALAGAAIVLFALASQARNAAAQHPASPRGTVSAQNVAPALELLSLHDARDGDTLTITGSVRNPRGASPLNRVTVSALAFDASGAYVGSGRALLDVTALAPGDESPFVISVPSAMNVARYRIAFRGEDGHVIAHTDRRQSLPVAERTSAALTPRDLR